MVGVERLMADARTAEVRYDDDDDDDDEEEGGIDKDKEEEGMVRDSCGLE